MGKYNKRLYKKILQTIIDSNGTDCRGGEEECLKCPCQEHCGDDDEKHHEVVKEWFKQFRK